MDEAAPYGQFEASGFVRRAVEFTRSLPDTWLSRRLVILVRRFATRKLKGAPVDIEALGLRLRLRPDRNICEKRLLFAPKTFDTQELAILAERILAERVTDGFRFIDVGANVGAYALFVASRAGPAARVLAIEPQPAIFDRLVYNIRLNAFATVKALDCAVADRSGDLTLFLDAQNSGESSVKLVRSSGATPIRVAGKTLLEIVEDEGFDRIDGMKLDVEGAEDLVLEPFLATAPRHLLPKLLVIENGVGQWQVDLAALLANAGYALLRRTRLNLVYERQTPSPEEPPHAGR